MQFTGQEKLDLLEVNYSKELQCVSIAHADEGVTTYFTAAVG